MRRAPKWVPLDPQWTPDNAVEHLVPIPYSDVCWHPESGQCFRKEDGEWQVLEYDDEEDDDEEG